MLIDTHTHLYNPTGYGQKAKEWNENQIHYSRKAGITQLWVSILGSWGLNSPVYLPSLSDFREGNRALHAFMLKYPDYIKGYCYINPLYGKKALEELRYCIEKLGMTGLKLGASCRAQNPALFPLIEKCIEYGIPVLHHVIQRRNCHIPGQEVSDADDIAFLAQKYPNAKIIHAHLGGGGDWEYALKAIKDIKNIYIDISGSGCDDGMMHMAYTYAGSHRLLFGSDMNLCTALAKLESLNIPQEAEAVVEF